MADQKRFTGDEGKFVPESDGKKMIQNYQDKNPKKIKAVFFGEKILKEILNEPKAVGIRFYFAEYDNGDSTLVMMGTDKEMNDIKKRDKQTDESMMSESLLTAKDGGSGDGGSGYANDGSPCPTFCGNQ